MRRAEMGETTSLQKIQVTCRTCGVTEAYYSNLSVDHFKLTHRGHDVVVSGDGSRPAAQPRPQPEPVVERPNEFARIEEAPREQQPPPEEGVTRVAKVLVDSVSFPALSTPVLRIRGFTADLELAFVVTSSPGNPTKIRDVLARGEYVDQGPTETRYVWDPDVIEFEEGTREKLGIPLEKPRAEPEDTVAKTNEMLFGPPQMDEAPPAPAEPEVPAAAPAPTPVPEPAPEQAPPPEPSPREPEVEEARAPVGKAPAPKRAKKKAQVVVVEPPRPSEARDEYLLVSKSWYVQGGNQNRQEAVRISKVLKEFRWKVEPVYTIGVMLDDLLSIETSRSEITRPLIERIEESGYRLTAVVVEQGKPVAWFKREPEPEAPAVEEPTRANHESPVEHASDEASPEPQAFGILDLTQPAPDSRETQ